MLGKFYGVRIGEAINIPSVMAYVCLSERGAAVTRPTAADTARKDCENLMMLRDETNDRNGQRILGD